MASAFNAMGKNIMDNSGVNARIKEAQAESIELDNEKKRQTMPAEVKQAIEAGKQAEEKTRHDKAMNALTEEITRNDEIRNN